MTNGRLLTARFKVRILPGSPRRSIRRTFRAVFSLGSDIWRHPTPTWRRRCRRNPILLAREWRDSLDRGRYRSAAELARTLGVSRARVSQVLRLLQLDEEILETISRIGELPCDRLVSERALRALLNLPALRQRERLAFMLGEAPSEGG